MNTKMNWAQLLTTTRFRIDEHQHIYPIEPKPNPTNYRTEFHVDYDRLVFSNAFRRLGRKTQVHPLAKNDHTHNRLTHSVEVASVGRSLGCTVGGMLAQQGRLPENTDINDLGVLVQVACLAHDLGNPPFGHTGEEALRQWFRAENNAMYLEKLSPAQRHDVQTYEGNAHSLRQIASLEMYGKYGGMRLTAATVGALLKYPWTSSHPEYGSKKFNIYQTELPYIRQVAHTLGLPEKGVDCWARHPLSYLMEAADDICYALMDLEDAIDLELIDFQDVHNILSPLTQFGTPKYPIGERDQMTMMRGMAIGLAIQNVAEKFMQHETALLNGEFVGKDLLAVSDDNVQEMLNSAKELARERIFRHRSKLMHELAAFPCVGLLLDLLVPAAHEWVVSGSLNAQQSLALELLKPNPILPDDDVYQAYMKILDYIGGMTDNHAAQMARELSGMSMI